MKRAILLSVDLMLAMLSFSDRIGIRSKVENPEPVKPPDFPDRIPVEGPLPDISGSYTDKVVMISSDRVVRPSSVIGASKRKVELVVQDLGNRASARELARQKLYEELRLGGDMQTTPHPKILRADAAHLSEIEVATMLRELRVVIENGDAVAARAVIAQFVDGYSPKNKKTWADTLQKV